MHRILFKFLSLSLGLILLYACQQKKKTHQTKAYEQRHEEFQQKLAEGRVHYLQLIGLHPIAPGTNFFGSSQTNTIHLNSQNTPAVIGVIQYATDSMTFIASDGVEVRTVASDSVVKSWSYEFETSINSPMLKCQHIEWMVLQRADKYFLRVKDQQNKRAKTFKGFEWYPLQEKYVIEAEYAPYQALKTEDVDNQIGKALPMQFAGLLSFKLGGEAYALTVGQGGFLIVGDATNGEDTYGGGRYLYVDLPETAGKTTIDFNQLYNPPCVYSEYTTCPLPPAQNILPIGIEAGEKVAQVVINDNNTDEK